MDEQRNVTIAAGPSRLLTGNPRQSSTNYQDLQNFALRQKICNSAWTRIARNNLGLYENDVITLFARDLTHPILLTLVCVVDCLLEQFSDHTFLGSFTSRLPFLS